MRDMDKVRENRRRHHEKHRARILERQRAWREANPDKKAAAQAKWLASVSPEKLEERRLKRAESARRASKNRTREDLDRINEQRRKRRAEGRMAPSERWKLSPEGRAAINAARRAVRAAARAARPRPVYSSPPPRRDGPSFPECAAPSPHRDLLVEITSRVARSDDRDDIIGQALLNVVEGMSIDEAVIRARRTVRAGASHLRYSVPFHDCHFL